MTTSRINTITQSELYEQPNRQAVFRRSREKWGEFSNMTGGFPIHVNGIRFQSSEGLYQAMKFPHSPIRQKAIAAAHNGYAAKTVAYQLGEQPDSEWDNHRVDAMRIALAFKLAQNPAFGTILLNTGDYDIIESSSRDSFWGATPVPNGLQGANILGKLLMELRTCLRHTDVKTPALAAQIFAADASHRQFLLDGQPLVFSFVDSPQPPNDAADQPF